VWITAILFLVFSLNLASSRAGRALRSLNAHDGGSEDGAQVLGINIMKYKLWVFVLSAIYASVAGGIYAHYTRVLEPGTFMLQLSAMLVLMAIIGGRLNPWGAFLGASLMVGLRQGLREYIPVLVGGLTGAYELIAYGSILIAALLFLPQGLISVVQKVALRKRAIVNES
jgi:branched-chain amino acid transport system permease protein